MRIGIKASNGKRKQRRLKGTQLTHIPVQPPCQDAQTGFLAMCQDTGSIAYMEEDPPGFLQSHKAREGPSRPMQLAAAGQGARDAPPPPEHPRVLQALRPEEGVVTIETGRRDSVGDLGQPEKPMVLRDVCGFVMGLGRSGGRLDLMILKVVCN